MIEVKNLTKRYGEHLALDNISFTVETGTIVGFLGPNGAGKSTTMNIITGYISATEGSVSIDGVDVLENPLEAKAKIGYLPEIPPLYGEMTVNEYLTFACDLKGVEPADRDKVLEEVSRKTRVQDFRGRLIRNLSKGYKQRVGLAQALIGDPEVLILDEPTVGLDPKQIIEIRDLIKKLGRDHTVLLSSHILSEVDRICDKMVIINRGRIVSVGTPEALAKRALGSNRLELRVKGQKNKILADVSALPGVKKAELIRVREEGTVDVAVEAEEGEDVRLAIFRYCADTNQPLLMMKADEVNLEDIFLQMTEGREAMKQ